MALAACTPSSREESRAVLSGTVVLVGVNGLNDMSRVRVDIGRGAGGAAPKEDGSFVFEDLEPDEYELVVTYIGGLTPEASGSAYDRYRRIVPARAGGNVNVGDIRLELARSTLEGEVTTSDGASADGAEVMLVDHEGVVRRGEVSEGKYSLTGVPVGNHSLQVSKAGYATPVAQSVCRPPVAVQEGNILVQAPPVVLAQTRPGLSPGFGE
ncbi:MAG: carboxypeptidase-like regulatory domain-containing protein, partial [Synechococcus sp.]|nr:carboxypeptidase-like regulatory domain-containing protein [Synechococcus sp.]